METDQRWTTRPHLWDMALRRHHTTGDSLLRCLRIVRHMTIDELAAASGVSRRAIWNAERGRVVPRLHTQARLLDGLGLPLFIASKVFSDAHA